MKFLTFSMKINGFDSLFSSDVVLASDSNRRIKYELEGNSEKNTRQKERSLKLHYFFSINFGGFIEFHFHFIKSQQISGNE